MDRTTLTAALKPLERGGLVAIAIDDKDRRSRRLVLTDRGRSTLVEAVPIGNRAHDANEARLDGLDPSALRTSLRAQE
ncbi:hypothetical protein [uncultured Methylobacterium sp.]|uniref:hypothetical protein n=1 Tax=uncultured Methylobacterium sp. TaxID=157278 RepID=UPI0035C9AC9B